MNIQNLQLGKAIRLVSRTMPILTVRLAAYLAFWFVALLYFGVVGTLAWLIGQALPIVGVIIMFVSLAGLAPIYRLAQQYVFYMIKAAHIAVLSELLVHGQLPAGVNQLQWGKEQVEARFGEANAMFVVDEMVTAVVRRFTRTVYRVARWLPSDSLRTLANVANRVITYATTYIDEAILARAFWLRSKSVWSSAQDGVVLYGMVWKPLLMNAIVLMLLSYVPFIAFFVVIGLPVGLLIAAVSPPLAGWTLMAMLVLAFLVKVAIGDAIAMTAMLASFQKETEGLEPDPAVSAKLTQMSDKFRELTQRARQEVAHLGQRPEAAPVEKPVDNVLNEGGATAV